jgi:hypothetical protein
MIRDRPKTSSYAEALNTAVEGAAQREPSPGGSTSGSHSSRCNWKGNLALDPVEVGKAMRRIAIARRNNWTMVSRILRQESE